MLGYVTLGTNRHEASYGFYDQILGLLGGSRMLEIPGRGVIWTNGAQMLAVMTPYDGNEATVGNGVMVALATDQRPTVDAVHARALELGGANEGDPGVRSSAELYPGAGVPELAMYIAYFRDVDANKLAISCPA